MLSLATVTCQDLARGLEYAHALGQLCMIKAIYYRPSISFEFDDRSVYVSHENYCLFFLKLFSLGNSDYAWWK